MNNVTPEKKSNVLKSLAIIGLFGVVILVAWLSVQIVNIFPNAVTSLASLADSVYSYEPKSDKVVDINDVEGPINSGEETTITWNKPLKNGTYAFSYECKEGLSVEIKTTENSFAAAECNKTYELGAVDNAQIIINSEKKLEEDFNYQISYFKTNSTSPAAEADKSFKIKNSVFAVNDKEDEIIVNEDIVITKPTEEKEEVEKEEVEAPVVVKPTPVKPKPTVPKKPTVVEYTYTYIPVSVPNGFTDLAVTYVGIGDYSAGKFTNTGLLKYGKAGMVQFSVKNIGTKTSEVFSFEALLPGKITYTSGTQLALKPNERATFTMEFPAVYSDSLQKFTASVKTKSDSNKKNDSIEWTTIVIK